MEKIFKHYPSCRRFLDQDILEAAAGAFPSDLRFPEVPGLLSSLTKDLNLPLFLAELAGLELLIHQVDSGPVLPGGGVGNQQVNPTLRTIDLSWRNLLNLTGKAGDDAAKPEPGRELVLLWRRPDSGGLAVKVADEEDLLVLKIVLEGRSVDEVAEAGKVPVVSIERALARGAARGLIQVPGSLLQRDRLVFPAGSGVDRERFYTARAFALQWHLTQACDLHCRHCYDRSSRDILGFEQALAVLDDLETFCRNRHVRGSISFSGGNPLLYPHFFKLYRAAKERGFNLAILGNPAGREILEELLSIRKPVHYQVSLEGLRGHNDYIRGEGHFERVMAFLDLLKEYDIYSMVMLTLTGANLDQVVPLAEALRGRADSFTFNRLTMVGEGAALRSVEPADFRKFLPRYLDAARENPALRLKENLFNIIRHRKGRELLRGCAGYGCGAAFNFITLLPDGEVHACRKFPSPVGNILTQNLDEIYDSAAAKRYRQGSAACLDCPIRPACGGCQAVVYGMGLDPAEDRDPYCFIDS
jgi:selenobiotic family peptide radical SAM maturase